MRDRTVTLSWLPVHTERRTERGVRTSTASADILPDGRSRPRSGIIRPTRLIVGLSAIRFPKPYPTIRLLPIATLAFAFHGRSFRDNGWRERVYEARVYEARVYEAMV